ncbi:MAG: hypothetical protein KDB03_22635 [Planctomycetales bacterium]|nr:hypothetical protein [Planctomycetales bacterium]
MTYLITDYFLSKYPGPFDIRSSRDGVDDTFEIVCLVTNQVLASTYYWDEEEARYIEAMGIATALNFMLHEEMVLEEGSRALKQLLTDAPGPYSLKRGTCEYRGGYWAVACKHEKDGIIQCYGDFSDYANLAIAILIKKSLTYADRYLPREREIPSCPESDLILF